MMEFSIAEQTLVFVQACAFGIFIGFVYDFFRSVRIITKAKFFLTAVFDTFFSVLLIISVFIFFINCTDGIIRFYIFAGIILGGCLYFLSVSSIYIKFMLFVLSNIGKSIGFLVKLPVKAKKIIKNKKN